MRRSIAVGVLVTLALLVPVALTPAAPAVAQTGLPGLNAECQTVERKVYTDIRKLITIDLATASDTQVRVLANQILSAVRADSLTTLPDRLQERLDGTADDLRTFLKTDLMTVWTTDLRVAVVQTLSDAGAHVKDAAQKALDAGTIDAFLAYLNNGLYDARALDCASASPSPSASASASPSASASRSASTSVSPSPSTVASLAKTGANTSVLALGAAALILVGVGFVLVARRFRA